MQLFMQVVRSGSLTLAAEYLNQTKSGLSQHISQLESDVGAQLLQRTTRRLTLTEQGMRFYQRSCELVELLDTAVDEVQQQQKSPSGSVTLTAPQALVDAIIIPAITEVRTSFSELQLKLIAEDKQLDLLEHQIDLAIRVGKLVDSNLRARRIGQFQEPWFCAPTKIDSKLATILLPWQTSTSNSPIIQVNTLAAAAQLALRGVGKAQLPDIFVRGIKKNTEQDLVIIESTEALDFIPIYAVHGYHKNMPFRVQLVLEKIENQLQLMNIN